MQVRLFFEEHEVPTGAPCQGFELVRHMRAVTEDIAAGIETVDDRFIFVSLACSGMVAVVDEDIDRPPQLAQRLDRNPVQVSPYRAYSPRSR